MAREPPTSQITPTKEPTKIPFFSSLLEQYCSSIDLPFELHGPKNIDELRAILESVRAAATAGVGPILHFDLHGSKKEGLRIADST
jgi:hypothetical protein